jgi:hypothetical protein
LFSPSLVFSLHDPTAIQLPTRFKTAAECETSPCGASSDGLLRSRMLRFPKRDGVRGKEKEKKEKAERYLEKEVESPRESSTDFSLRRCSRGRSVPHRNFNRSVL